ncbi:hypothetical protein BaRGS_00006471 [Batillaria attramentaria]|uniref:Uncharacterized protein n=1 Tax=Batillaria attramentaria TaxID=370345 RepID=A0ABD0LT32_9CAEN
MPVRPCDQPTTADGGGSAPALHTWSCDIELCVNLLSWHYSLRAQRTAYSALPATEGRKPCTSTLSCMGGRAVWHGSSTDVSCRVPQSYSDRRQVAKSVVDIAPLEWLTSPLLSG